VRVTALCTFGSRLSFVLDDRTTILLNPSLVALSDWRGILTYDRWHPLVNASFAFDRRCPA
jgi:hypothetical protein